MASDPLDPGTPASPEVVAHAVAEARAALSRLPRPRPAGTPVQAPTGRGEGPRYASEVDAVAALFAALRRLRAAVSEVEAALADAAPYLSDPSQAASSPDPESRADDLDRPTPQG